MDEDLIIKKLSEIDAKLDRAATRDQLERFEVKVENRFEGVDNRLGRVETKVESVDNRLGRVETKVESMDNRLGRVETKVESVDNRLGRVETKVESVDNRLGRVEDHLVDHEDRLVVIQENMVTKDELNSFKEEMRDGMDKQLVILQRLDQERVFSDERIKRVEEDVETIKLKLKTV